MFRSIFFSNKEDLENVTEIFILFFNWHFYSYCEENYFNNFNECFWYPDINRNLNVVGIMKANFYMPETTYKEYKEYKGNI